MPLLYDQALTAPRPMQRSTNSSPSFLSTIGIYSAQSCSLNHCTILPQTTTRPNGQGKREAQAFPQLTDKLRQCRAWGEQREAGWSSERHLGARSGFVGFPWSHRCRTSSPSGTFQSACLSFPLQDVSTMDRTQAQSWGGEMCSGSGQVERDGDDFSTGCHCSPCSPLHGLRLTARS